MAVPIGSPRRISKEDFIKQYSGDYSYSNGVFYKRAEAVPTAFYDLLKNAQKLLPQSTRQKIRAFLAGFIPFLRDKPIQIEVVNNLGTNCVKYIDDNGNVYIVFDRDFVETLSEHEYDHREVVLHILAERLAHELAHSNSALTREELKAEEARIILEVDLPLHRKTLDNKELQSRIDRFFSEAKRSLQAQGREMFHSGRYYSSSAKAVLGHLASLPPDKAKAAAEWFVNRFYDGSDIQNNLMAIPIQDIWRREAIIESDFKQMLADQRRDVMTTELRRLFRKVPRNFVGDFIKSMPGEHILAAAPIRLVRECGLAYRMSRKFMVEALGNDYVFTVYNPPDADHTEVMIFGKESSRLMHDTTEVLNRMADEGALVHPVSNWSYAAGGVGITVFELKNISSLGPEDDKAKGVALTDGQVNMLKDLCRSIYPGKTRYIDADELLEADPLMAAELGKIASQLESLTPEEIEISSVKGDEVLFLTVRQSTSFLDCTKMVGEDIWTEHDTLRQRKTKIAEQSERMRKAMDDIVPGLALSGESLYELGESAMEAHRALEDRGKNFLFTLDRSIKPYLDRLLRGGKKKEAGKIAGLLANLREIEDSSSRLEDDRVEREISVLNRAINAMKVNAERLIDAATTEEAKDVAKNTISFLSDQIFFDEVRDFVRSKKRRSYVKLLDKAIEMWPIVQTFMGNIADIKKEKIPEAEKSGKLKVYECLIDAYMTLMELVRYMHSADRPLPAVDGIMDIETSQIEEAFSEALGYLDRSTKDSIEDFIDYLPSKLFSALAVGGPDASELVNRFVEEYSLLHPSLAKELNRFAAFFTIAMEGRVVPSIDPQDQSATIYVTDAMDQVHAFKFIDKNPAIAAIATETGNSRSHWVITIEDMLTVGRREPIMVIPGVAGLKSLETGDLIVIDSSRRRIVRNPQSNPAVMRYYEERLRDVEILKEIYSEHMAEDSVARDGQKIKFLSDIPRIEPDASLVKGYGASGVGLIRMENMYMQKSEPTEDEIYTQALNAADSVEGPV
ncbi:MAG TPA: hypothetical protein PLV52_03165, partial [Candidatus Omnitrophota bacterium]|nr:hypothetical protein [Candidatus Omnitrophota bacterium]